MKEMSEGAQLELGWAILEVRNAKLVFRGGGQWSHVEVAGQGDPTFIVFPMADWFVCVEAEASDVWGASVSRPNLRRLASLPRLDLAAQYDPGGMHWVAFRQVDPTLCAILNEESLGVVERDHSLRWRFVHADLTTSLAEVSSERIVLVSELQQQEFDAQSGALVTTAPYDNPEWVEVRRHLGRRRRST